MLHYTTIRCAKEWAAVFVSIEKCKKHVHGTTGPAMHCPKVCTMSESIVPEPMCPYEVREHKKSSFVRHDVSVTSAQCPHKCAVRGSRHAHFSPRALMSESNQGPKHWALAQVVYDPSTRKVRGRKLDERTVSAESAGPKARRAHSQRRREGLHKVCDWMCFRSAQAPS